MLGKRQSVMKRGPDLKRKSSRSRSYGFTLIEVIAVLSVATIFGYVLKRGCESRYKDDLIAELDLFKARLRYTQTMAMADEVAQWGVEYQTSLYRITRDGTPVNLPNGTTTEHQFSRGVYLHSRAGSVFFDNRGRPLDAAGRLLRADRTLTLVGENYNNRSLTITRSTGFIP